MRFPPQIFSIFFCSLHTFCGFRYNPLTLFLFCWLLKYQLTDGMSCSRLLRMNPLVSESGNGKVAVEWIRIDCILVAGTRYSFCRFFTYFLWGAATPAVSWTSGRVADWFRLHFFREQVPWVPNIGSSVCLWLCSTFMAKFFPCEEQEMAHCTLATLKGI